MGVNTSFLKRLIKEDFKKQDQDLVSKIAFILNPALQQITNILTNGLLLSDLNTQVKEIELTVNSSGVPITDASFKSTLKGKCSMIMIGRAQCLDNSTTFPTSGHSVSFNENNGQITITHITGLPANARFQLRAVAFV